MPSADFNALIHACKTPELADVEALLLANTRRPRRSDPLAIAWDYRARIEADRLFDVFLLDAVGKPSRRFTTALGKSVKDQHEALVYWSMVLGRYFAPAPSLGSNGYYFPWATLDQRRSSWRRTSAVLRSIARQVLEGNETALTIVALLKLQIDPSLRARLDVNPFAQDAEKMLSAALLEHQIPSRSKVAQWCTTLASMTGRSGNPHLPGAVHALAHETWTFYESVLGGVPTVNANTQASKPSAHRGSAYRRSTFVEWSHVVATIALGPIGMSEWISALRARRGDGGTLARRLLSSSDVSATRQRFVPWGTSRGSTGRNTLRGKSGGTAKAKKKVRGRKP